MLMRLNSSKQHHAPENAKPSEVGRISQAFSKLVADAHMHGTFEEFPHHDVVHLRWAVEDHALLRKCLQNTSTMCELCVQVCLCL